MTKIERLLRTARATALLTSQYARSTFVRINREQPNTGDRIETLTLMRINGRVLEIESVPEDASEL